MAWQNGELGITRRGASWRIEVTAMAAYGVMASASIYQTRWYDRSA